VEKPEKATSNDDPLDNVEPLTRIFKTGPLRQWAVEDIVKDNGGNHLEPSAIANPVLEEGDKPGPMV
jgi:hypothetical protein